MSKPICILLMLFLFPSGRAVALDSAISDIPMETRVRAAPAHIMIVVDDSWSMDRETQINDGAEHPSYVLDDPGDHILAHSALIGKDRMKWRYQWSGWNRLYYDPKADYRPWPGLPEADPESPRSHPMDPAHTIRLDATYATVDDGAVHLNDAEAVYSGRWTRIPGQLHYSVYMGSTALYTPYLERSGTFEVLAYADSRAGYWDGRARYTVTHAGVEGPTTVQRAQGSGNGWVSLGRYDFAAGGGGSVLLERISPDGPGGAGPTCADELAFIPLSPSATAVEVRNAHYYAWSAEEQRPYLVNLDRGAVRYYAVNDAVDTGGNGDHRIDPGELAPAHFPPSDVTASRSAEAERRNFANWYSFHRRRSLAATGAAAGIIAAVKGVRVGLFGVNAVSPGCGACLMQPVLPVRLQGDDRTSDLLSALYAQRGRSGRQGTPLRRALQRIGQYFHQDDGIRLDGGPGDDSPYASADEGGHCQKAFVIVVSDGCWNGPEPDGANDDGDNGPPYADIHPRTLADVAMRYYENDLSSALGQNVTPGPLDDAVHQHMVTYVLSLGALGTIDPLDLNGNGLADASEAGTTGYAEDPGFRNPSTPVPPWPDPRLGCPPKVDDLFHAAVNGRGVFYPSKDPGELCDHLLKAAENAWSGSGSAAAPTLAAEDFSPGAMVYQTSFDSDGWTGELTATPLEGDTGRMIPPEERGRFQDMGGWKASEPLKDRSWDERVIVTYDGESQGSPFRWDALSPQQKRGLDPDWERDTADPTLGERVVRYLRGKEVDGFRPRSSKLGDFMHAAPVLGEGAAGGTVYAGGNGGMLHAFDARTGRERFAYVPNLLLANRSYHAGLKLEVSHLRELTLSDYGHRFYVDGTPHIRRVHSAPPFGGKAASCADDRERTGRTLLVGGLGKGGKGYYALDITGAEAVADEAAAARCVLWEYPGPAGGEDGEADPDMGFSFSRAVIVLSNYLKGNAGGEEPQWVVVFGNGYESSGGRAMLYVLDLEGNLIRKIGTGPGGPPANGLSTPSLVDGNGDGRVDYAYAGDLQGNLWKFDLTAEDPAAWDSAFADGHGPRPLFRAVFRAPGQDPRPQPITTQPDVMRHCSGNGYMVVFGTGRFLGEDDLADADTQTLYGIWDYGDDTDDGEYLGEIVDRDSGTLSRPAGIRLLRQEEIDWRTSEDGRHLRTLSDHSADWRTSQDPDGRGQYPDPAAHAGWFFDLPGFGIEGERTRGERVVQDPFIRDGRIVAVSMVPGRAPCDGEGLSMVHEMDACTGGRLAVAAMDYNADGEIDTADSELIDIRNGRDEVQQVAPTGLSLPGIVHSPAILRIGEGPRTREMKIFSSSSGHTVQLLERPERRRMVSWREWTRE